MNMDSVCSTSCAHDTKVRSLRGGWTDVHRDGKVATFMSGGDQTMPQSLFLGVFPLLSPYLINNK